MGALGDLGDSTASPGKHGAWKSHRPVSVTSGCETADRFLSSPRCDWEMLPTFMPREDPRANIRFRSLHNDCGGELRPWAVQGYEFKFR